MALVCISFGLRISECLALKWSDVDWLNAKLTVERGIVRQVVGDVKTEYSGRAMSIDPAMLMVLKAWRQETQFADDGDWLFASPLNWVVYRGLIRGCGGSSPRLHGMRDRQFRYAHDAS